MPRGRQFYNPIIASPDDSDPTETLERIELFPVTEDTRYEIAKVGKWVGRRINPDGSVGEVSPGDYDHGGALRQAQEMWPGLTVFELRSEFEDSTWTGAGPSPRLWQGSSPATDAHTSPALAILAGGAEVGDLGAGDDTTAGSNVELVQLRVFPISEAGTYVLLDDIRILLESWAVQYEVEKNPSAAMALREAVDALRDVG